MTDEDEDEGWDEGDDEDDDDDEEDDEDEDDEDFEADKSDVDEETDTEESEELPGPRTLVEKLPLQLPSTEGRSACIASGKTGLMDREIQLRTAQANDALSQIRLALGYKSFLWMEYRDTQNYKGRTRSSGAIRTAEKKVQKHVAAYGLAFKALTRLDSGGQFRPITKVDLKLNFNIVKGNQIGQSEDALSWIWTTGEISQEEENGPWQQEGEYSPLLPCSGVHCACS